MLNGINDLKYQANLVTHVSLGRRFHCEHMTDSHSSDLNIRRRGRYGHHVNSPPDVIINCTSQRRQTSQVWTEVNWLATKASQWVNGWKNFYTFYACCLEFPKKFAKKFDTVWQLVIHPVEKCWHCGLYLHVCYDYTIHLCTTNHTRATVIKNWKLQANTQKPFLPQTI